MEDVEALQKRRQTAKANITRIKNIISDSMSLAELECRLSLVEAYFKQLLAIQTEIEQHNPKDTSRVDIEELCITTKAKIIQLLGDNYKRQGADASISVPFATQSKLPSLELPKFDGKYSAYKNFMSSFRQFVHNDSSLSNIEKFNHLLHCLSGQALDTIRAFQITAENYEKAIKRLEERYDNKTLIFMEHIQNLYELPSLNTSSGTQLRSLVDSASAIFSSLNSLGNSDDVCNALIIYIINEKADNDTQAKWRENLDYARLPSWDQFCKFLERRCQFLDSSQNLPSVSENKPVSQKRHINRQQNYRSFHTQQKSCSLCKCLDHWLTGCSKFQTMNIENRFITVKKLGLCINCLSEGHVVSKCKSKNKCKNCNKSHHTMLHRLATATSNYDSSPPVIQSAHLEQPSYAVVNIHVGKAFDGVILATAVLLVRDTLGGFTLCRALLDSCSQVNLITEDFANILNLPKIKTSVNISGVGSTSTKIKFAASTVIRSRYNNHEYPMNFYITNRVSGYQPDMDLDIKSWNLPNTLVLADEQFNRSQRIDMLIGADAFFEILGSHKIKLGPGLPTLQETCLGYVVSGSYKVSNKSCSTQAYTTIIDNTYENLDKQLEILWSMEKVSISKPYLNVEHQTCEINFINNVEVLSDGKLQVMLPFKNDPSALGVSYTTALKRFHSLEKRLSHDSNIKQQYMHFMKEYEEMGHMSIVEPSLDKPHFYLPHQYVLKPNSVSTKLRVVFDASSKTSSMKSLNDVLCVGPTIQDELFLLLIRFRLCKYALTADITKMYRMVVMHPSHRAFQQILWRYDETQPINTYQLNTVTYGMSSSPYLAIRCLHFLADKYQHIYQIGSKIVKTQFYVDDLLTGANDVDTICKIKEETTMLLKQGGFELTKFKSNYPLLQSDGNQAKHIKLNDQTITSALGIMWDPITDQFLFSFQPKKQYAIITKRAILSLVSSIFDPLGLIYPLVIQPRVLLQDLWIAKTGWDTEVTRKVKDLFSTFVEDLRSLHLLKVPRYILINQAKIQLHGFCDSSLRAYGCCIYVRSKDTTGQVSVHLITSKCRVAPTRKRTMPQLELCAAHLLSKLYTKILPVFEKFNPETFLWSDSMVVLSWLTKHSSALVTFVGNRISDIQAETLNCNWRHVPTSHNPADILSRGCSLSQLSSSNWYTGPSFLHEPPNKWPQTTLPLQNDIAETAVRKSCFKNESTENRVLSFINRVSSYNKMLRVVCWMFRVRYKSKNNNFSSDEINRALKCVVWIIQQNNFADEIKNLNKNQQIKSSLKSLDLFIQDVNGFPLIRVGGRLQQSNIPESRKHPFLLPKNCHFVKILVRDKHINNYHAGPKALLAFVRQNFWIISARNLTRQIVRSCVSCIRYRPKLVQQVMGELPAERVTPARPFERCGVDFCGPIHTYLKIRGKQPYKCYIAIFVCFVTKAVHIEAVSDLSADAFIAALKRLIGRRGLPSNIYCDNATNFIGANAQLLELKKLFMDDSFQNAMHLFCSKRFINFNFIPPRAPHFGGLWEATVKSAKGHLYRSLSNARMTYEELSTTLIEIEAIMNSRPITSHSSDPNDLEPLTPGHFLIGGPLNCLPESNIECHDITNLQRWKRIIAAKQHFWKRWSTDYLNELIQKSRWSESKPNLKPNTLVLIHEDNMPPMKWVIGRIIKTYPGKDGKVRVADVNTAKGIYRRPVHKLAILVNP